MRRRYVTHTHVAFLYCESMAVAVTAAASYRVRLFNSIRDALYTTDSNASAALIPSLDLIKIISRLAGPYEQLVIWQPSTLHALDICESPPRNGGGGAFVSDYRLLARRAADILVPRLNRDILVPFVLSLAPIPQTGGSGTGSSAGTGSSDGCDTDTGSSERVVVSMVYMDKQFRILQSSAPAPPPPPVVVDCDTDRGWERGCTAADTGTGTGTGG